LPLHFLALPLLFDKAWFQQLLRVPHWHQLRLFSGWHMDDLVSPPQSPESSAPLLRWTHVRLPTSMRVKDNWTDAPPRCLAQYMT